MKKNAGSAKLLMATFCAMGISIGCACRVLAADLEIAMDAKSAEGITRELALMMLKSLRNVSDVEARKVRESNFSFVSNLLYECKIQREFTRLGDGTPFLSDSIDGCDGAYKEIPCFVAIDDKYVHGGAVFPEACVKNTNVIEFVALANRVVNKGHFEYDFKHGFVMYTLSMPVSAIRENGKSTLGMVYGFPVMEIDFFSEAYKAVLGNEKTPRDAIVLIEEKLKKINSDEVRKNPSEDAAAAIRKFFEGKGLAARAVKLGERIGFVGTTTCGHKEGLRNDKYEFRIEIDEEWVYSFVRLPNVSTNRQAEVEKFVALLNKELEDSCNTLIFHDRDESVICRSQIHVVEFLKDIPDSISRILRHPVDILDQCSASIEKIVSGKLKATTAMAELKSGSCPKNRPRE